MRLPLEEKFRVCSWQELATADFPYETNRYYRLRVENRRRRKSARSSTTSSCSPPRDDELAGGKVGLSANTPARFQDFRVSVTPQTNEQIAAGIQKRQR